ncbi:Cross-pathway control protein [Lachnellula hyalina]|uniref:Cross-pathway control protein n=1 Tax=Lachnellula hyalina TaxID=1316788 RepID=A0A8H8TVA7_9HELO|nr:Cross-pathway control protein [Lachnellula hyalina]TVY23157.1 Cross-pathway control protein [Lachnellula hyalina]
MASLQFIEPAGTFSSSIPAQQSSGSLRSLSAPSATSGLCSVREHSAFTGQNRRHSAHLTPSSSASSLQNQRVAAIINATGHSIHTSGLTNRFNQNQSSAQSPHQFYASSAPSSSTSLQQQRPTRPPVPLFSQSTGNIPQTPNMAMQGTFTAPTFAANSHDSRRTDMDLFDEFTAFEGGASSAGTYNNPSAFPSPAVPTMYDNQNLSSSSSTNMGTVSPQDLLVRDPFASAPNSTSFTNLTSPSTYGESPEYNGDFDVSPYVHGDDFGNAQIAGDPWYPLFPQDDQVSEQTKVEESPLLPEEELEVSEHLRASGRRRSGTAGSPPGSHSSVSGVNSRKRDKPLPPIIVEDPNDTIAMKRARNTLAARKSRQRKMQKMEELEDELEKVRNERDHWKSIALKRGGGSSH